jgi:hypothetical protein
VNPFHSMLAVATRNHHFVYFGFLYPILIYNAQENSRASHGELCTLERGSADLDTPLFLGISCPSIFPNQHSLLAVRQGSVWVVKKGRRIISCETHLYRLIRKK